MKRWQAIALVVVAGTALGLGSAWASLQQGLGGLSVTSGPWATSRAVGSAQAGARTRAVVALSGLLALPAREALYYTARTDSAGAALDGKCRYVVSGGALPVRWWSLTGYDRDGYLIATPERRYSVAGENAARQGDRWRVPVGPADPGDGAPWISTGGQPFELTLRAYGPSAALQADPATAPLPSIVKEMC